MSYTEPSRCHLSDLKVVGGAVFPPSMTLDSPYSQSNAISFFDKNGNHLETSDTTYALAQYTTAGTYIANHSNTNGFGNDIRDTLVVTDVPAVTRPLSPTRLSLQALPYSARVCSLALECCVSAFNAETGHAQPPHSLTSH